MKLFKSGMKKGLLCRKHFFSQRVVNEWNSLSEKVVSAQTVNQFKNRLDQFWDKTLKLGTTKRHTPI
jgi:hypothetical protein